MKKIKIILTIFSVLFFLNKTIAMEKKQKFNNYKTNSNKYKKSNIFNPNVNLKKPIKNVKSEEKNSPLPFSIVADDDYDSKKIIMIFKRQVNWVIKMLIYNIVYNVKDVTVLSDSNLSAKHALVFIKKSINEYKTQTITNQNTSDVNYEVENLLLNILDYIEQKAINKTLSYRMKNIKKLNHKVIMQEIEKILNNKNLNEQKNSYFYLTKKIEQIYNVNKQNIQNIYEEYVKNTIMEDSENLNEQKNSYKNMKENNIDYKLFENFEKILNNFMDATIYGIKCEILNLNEDSSVEDLIKYLEKNLNECEELINKNTTNLENKQISNDSKIEFKIKNLILKILEYIKQKSISEIINSKTKNLKDKYFYDLYLNNNNQEIIYNNIIKTIQHNLLTKNSNEQKNLYENILKELNNVQKNLYEILNINKQSFQNFYEKYEEKENENLNEKEKQNNEILEEINTNKKNENIEIKNKIAINSQNEINTLSEILNKIAKNLTLDFVNNSNLNEKTMPVENYIKQIENNLNEENIMKNFNNFEEDEKTKKLFLEVIEYVKQKAIYETINSKKEYLNKIEKNVQNNFYEKDKEYVKNCFDDANFYNKYIKQSPKVKHDEIIKNIKEILNYENLKIEEQKKIYEKILCKLNEIEQFLNNIKKIEIINYNEQKENENLNEKKEQNNETLEEINTNKKTAKKKKKKKKKKNEEKEEIEDESFDELLDKFIEKDKKIENLTNLENEELEKNLKNHLQNKELKETFLKLKNIWETDKDFVECKNFFEKETKNLKIKTEEFDFLEFERHSLNIIKILEKKHNFPLEVFDLFTKYEIKNKDYFKKFKQEVTNFFTQVENKQKELEKVFKNMLEHLDDLLDDTKIFEYFFKLDKYKKNEKENDFDLNYKDYIEKIENLKNSINCYLEKYYDDFLKENKLKKMEENYNKEQNKKENNTKYLIKKATNKEEIKATKNIFYFLKYIIQLNKIKFKTLNNAKETENEKIATKFLTSIFKEKNEIEEILNNSLNNNLILEIENFIKENKI